MRVLHVLEAIEAGVARHVTDVVRHVEAEHVVVSPAERVGGLTDTTAFAAMRDAGGAIEVVPMRRSVTDPRNALATLRIRQLVRRYRPDVVHGHASIGGVAARLAATGTGAARVYTPNGLMHSRLVRFAERGLGRLTDRLVAVSPSEGTLMRKLGIAPPDRIVVIPNGIDVDPPCTPSFDIRADLGVNPTTPVVGTVGRVAAQKAPETFVRACALVSETLPEARFVMIGDGPLTGVVAGLVSAHGLDGRFRHYRGIPQAASVMGQLDAFVLLSQYEGGPYAPLEAMRAETPVVLSDVIGNRDTVVTEESGLVVPPGDPQAAAQAVLRVVTDLELARRLAAGGRARLTAHFDVQVMARCLSAVYEALVRT